MTRKEKLNRLTEKGRIAGLAGLPCDSPTRTELDRAAWEIGYRMGKTEKDIGPKLNPESRRQRIESALTAVKETQTAFWDAVSDLERLLLNVTLDSTEDFTGYDVDALLAMEEEEAAQ